MSAKHIPAIALALVIILIAAFSVTACGGYESTVSIPATSVPATQPVSARPGPQMTMDPVGPLFTPQAHRSAQAHAHGRCAEGRV